ncbi:hypothetical protein V2J09_018898 [Rumex salicifolius]
MVEKEDLGLSLSLGCPNSCFNRSLHLRTSSSTSSAASPFLQNHPFASLVPLKSAWNDSFGSADRTSDALYRSIGAAVSPVALMAAGEPRSCLKGIDVNRSAGEEDEAGVSSPNSTISSISGKRSEREATVGAGDDQDAERGCSRGISDEEDGETSRKKLRLSKDQSAVLEESFKEHSTLNPKQKLALANRLGLRTRQVEVWFQNRRARTKLKQTEVDCDFLRRCCEQLTEENKRLQKEVQELRSLKMSPQFYMQMNPPTTLTMCPSCERVGAPASASAATDADVRRLPWGSLTGRKFPMLSIYPLGYNI